MLLNICDCIRRYVVLSDTQATAITLHVAHTHAVAAADTTPYLSITSATKRAGKTRLLEVLETLVAEPWLTSRTTAAALVRKVDSAKPTLLLDETDTAWSGEREYAEALRGLLNSGYKRSGKASLCIGKGAKLEVRDFSTFSPKVIAGIGKLPDTVADRSIPIVLRRKTKFEVVARWREVEGHAAASPIRDALKEWASGVLDQLRSARPALPPELSDRAQDVWEPLLAIADAAGGDWPERARRAAVTLMGNVEDSDPIVELLLDIRGLLDGGKIGKNAVIPTAALIDGLIGLTDRPWATWRHQEKPLTPRGLAVLLGPLGIHPNNQLRVARGYPLDAFCDAFERYLPAQASQCHSLVEKQGKSDDACTRDGCETSDDK